MNQQNHRSACPTGLHVSTHSSIQNKLLYFCLKGCSEIHECHTACLHQTHGCHGMKDSAQTATIMQPSSTGGCLQDLIRGTSITWAYRLLGSAPSASCPPQRTHIDVLSFANNHADNPWITPETVLIRTPVNENILPLLDALQSPTLTVTAALQVTGRKAAAMEHRARLAQVSFCHAHSHVECWAWPRGFWL